MRGVKNSELKKQAIVLRRRGYTYPMIEEKLSVPKATLNGWFTGLALSPKTKKKLSDRKKQHLVVIRKIALDLLKEKRKSAFDQLSKKIDYDFSSFDFNLKALELLLAMLYLGEGFKKTRSHIGLGNSDPKIMSVFVKLLRKIYGIEDERLKCYLHLRSDQDETREREFWSKMLSIKKEQFGKTQFDKRTKGSVTWEGYHGVCSVYCYDAKIEKRLVLLQKYLINKILGP